MTFQPWPGEDCTRIKICGIRDPDMAAVAVEAGASAIGLVHHEPSPRHVDQETAHSIREHLPAHIAVVNVVVDPPANLLSKLEGWIQLHGQETEAIVATAPGPVIRGFSFSPEEVLRWDACPGVQLLLLDGPGKGAGVGFDHDALLALQDQVTTPIVIAGGLCPDTVGDVVSTLRPWGVDVSSGVESERGVKDPGRIRAFCQAVRSAEA